MAQIKSNYGTSNQPITITLNSLANGAVRASTAADNSANCFLDAMVQLKITTGASAPSGDKNVLVYAYGSADSGQTYSGAATGSDESFGAAAGQLIDNCKLLGIVTVDAASETFESDLFSVAGAFGGVLPERWGIIVKNQTGQALGAGCGAFYQGVFAQAN
jgi:hypothetical protein